MEKTLLFIKPDGVKRKIVGEIFSILEKNFTIEGIRMVRMDRTTAEKFYEMHTGKPFFESLVEYITSGTIVAVLLSGKNVVKRLREIVGSTDPKKAKQGTLRNLYGIDIQKNTVHASDSIKSAKREISFFFKKGKNENIDIKLR